MKLFVDDLTVIDCSLLDVERGLTGMSWIVDLELEGNLDDQSMVMDFGHVKKDIKHWIDTDGPDHRLVVPIHDEACIAASVNTERSNIEYQPPKGGTLQMEAPSEAVFLLHSESVTAEAVQAALEALINARLAPRGITARLKLRAEVIDTPSYGYSHGLKKHDGNCQRIAHGHRSKLHIWRNGTPAPELVQDWASKWQDIYIGSAEDITEQTETLVRFAYAAPQGDFSLSLPASKCCIIDSDSTVECIAAYIAQTLKAAEPEATFRVKAYEGVKKGAIAEA